MKNFLLLVYLVTIICFTNCTKNRQVFTEQLRRAKDIIEDYPDSTLIILDSIIAYELDDSHFNEYSLLYVQAKDKAYKDISSDTSIFQVKKYFLSKNDLNNSALATYYCGRVLQEQNKDKQSMNEYLEAEKYAKNSNDNLKGLIQGNIGQLFQNQLLTTKANQHFFSAIEYFIKAENKRNEIATYKLIGNSFLMAYVNDSAFYYYNKGLSIAKATNDSVQIAMINLCKGVAYRQIGNDNAAIGYFRQSDNYTVNNNYKSRFYLNIPKTLHENGLQDSVRFYADELFTLAKDEDIFVATGIYKTLSEIEERKSNYKQSLGYYKDYTKKLEIIVNENKNKEILKLQKKYEYEQSLNENDTIKIKQQQLLIIFSTLFLICCLIILFFYKKSIQNKKAILEKENKVLDAEKKFFQMIEMLKSYDEREKNFRNILLHHFNILSKAATLEKYVKGDNKQDSRLIRKFNEIVYGQESLNWDLLYRDMNEIHDHLFDRLEDKYPSLDDTEFRICCMTYVGFSCIEIGIIIDLSPNTVQMKRSTIRKKLGVEPQGNIQKYLDSKL